MLWFPLASLGAACDGAYYIVIKRMLATMDRYVLAAGGYLTTGLLLFFLALVRGIPPVGIDLFPAIAATTALNIVATMLVFQALSTTDISLAVPMISFTPIFLIATSFLLLGEVPTPLGIAGICVIVAGSYFLNLSMSHKKLLDPLTAILKNRGTASMLIVAFLYSVSLNFDKMVVLNSDPVFGSAFVCLLLGVSFFLIGQASVLHERREKRGAGYTNKLEPSPEVSPSGIMAPYLTGGTAFLVIGALLTIESVAINSAFTLQIVPYVIAIKRMSIIITVVYGTMIAAEGEVYRRLAGAGLMVAGATIIILSM